MPAPDGTSIWYLQKPPRHKSPDELPADSPIRNHVTPIATNHSIKPPNPKPPIAKRTGGYSGKTLPIPTQVMTATTRPSQAIQLGARRVRRTAKANTGTPTPSMRVLPTRAASSAVRWSTDVRTSNAGQTAELAATYWGISSKSAPRTKICSNITSCRPVNHAASPSQVRGPASRST